MKVQNQRKADGADAGPGQRATPDEQGHGADSTANSAAVVTPELIRARAYDNFLARRSGDGDALADWLLAERELTGSDLPAGTPGVAVNLKPPADDSSADSSGTPT